MLRGLPTAENFNFQFLSCAGAEGVKLETTFSGKLMQIHNARNLEERAPPGNRLERLSADRKGQHSIRINDQWRICFRWRDGDAHDVEIVDYH